MNDKKKLNNESSDYREEMEELARIFKEELDKAVQESEESAVVENLDEVEVEGYAVSTGEAQPAKELTEDELCECCGERARGTEKNPNSPFCSECEAILEKYPYDWKGATTAIVMLFVTLAAIICFIINVPVFSYTIEGEKAYNDNQLYTAIQKYDKAVSSISEEDEGKFLNVYEKRIYANYCLLDMDSVVNDAGSYFSDAVLKLPMYKDVAKIEEEIIGMQATVLVIQDALANYSDISENNYDEVIGVMDALIGQKIYVSGSSYHLESEEDFTATGNEDIYVCDEGWINIYKYSVAQYLGKDDTIIAGFLAEAADKSDYLSMLVNPLLAATYVGTGEYEKAELLLPAIKNVNVESIDSHMIQAMLYRYRDNNYQGAVDVCIEGLNMLSRIPDGSDLVAQVGYILSMQKTLNYIMMKDYVSAYESAYECYSYQAESYSISVQVRDMYAMLALQTGDTDTYTTLEEEIAEYGEDAAGFSSDVADYRAGRVTLQELAQNGGYDLL